MPNLNWNLEWQNHNSQRSYPLADSATGKDTSGTFTIPLDFIAELDLPIHAGMDVDPARFFIMSIGAFGTGYSVVVGYQPATDGADPVAVATALIPAPNHVRGTVYALGGIAPFDDTIGKIVIWKLDNIATQPPGQWTFDFEATRLDPDAVSPYIRGVSALQVVNGNTASPKLQGLVQFIAGSNCQLVPRQYNGMNQIVVNFLDGAGTVDTCVCEGDTIPSTPITNINGIRPTADGELTIIGSDCIQIVPIANGLQIKNTCAIACCSCPELERITSDLEALKAERLTVEQFANSLENAVDAMNMTVLGSKLNDQGCSTC